MMPKSTLWSSVGASSLGENMNIGTVHRLTRIQTRYTAGRARNVAPSARPYASRNESKRRLIQPAKPRSWSSALLSSLEAITGDSVSATMPEIVTAPASVSANSRNSAPVRPPCRPIGA